MRLLTEPRRRTDCFARTPRSRSPRLPAADNAYAVLIVILFARGVVDADIDDNILDEVLEGLPFLGVERVGLFTVDFLSFGSYIVGCE